MDEERQALNDSHPPGVGFNEPIDAHGVTDTGSTVPAELAAGTVIVASQPAPTLIDTGFAREMSHHAGLWSREPSGAAITPFSPHGIHDVDHDGRPA